MSKSISISDPSKVQSLKVEPYGSGDKIGGKLNLKIFSSATNIDVSDLDIEELGELPSNLVILDGSNNKITNIPNTFSVPDSITNFNLRKNSLTKSDINNILDGFIATGDVTATNPDPIIDVSKRGNAVPDSDGLTKIGTLQTNGWDVRYNRGEYVLSSDAINVSEGGLGITIDIDRTTSDIADGEVIPFAISGVQTADFTSIGFDGGAAPSNLQGSFTMANNTDSATFSLATDVGVSNYLEGESLTMSIYQLTDITSETSPPLPDGTYNITVQGKPIAVDIASGSATNDISALQIYVPETTSELTVPLASNGVRTLGNYFIHNGRGYSTDVGVATTTNGSGTNLTVDIDQVIATASTPGEIRGLSINNAGTGYLPNDIITITNPYGVGAVLRAYGVEHPVYGATGQASTYIGGSGFTPGVTTNISTSYHPTNPSWLNIATGNGNGFTVDVTANANGNITKVVMNQYGTDYLIGDRLIINAGNNPTLRISQVSVEATITVAETLGDVNLTLTGTLVDEISIPIIDTTILPYQLTSISSTTEGNNIAITISTTAGTTVANGTTVPYTITGIQDNDIVESREGVFTLNNNTDTVTIQPIADADADENETMVLTLDDYPSVNTSIRLFDS